jgi:aminopeptidase N
MVVGVAEFAVDTLAVLDGIPIVSWTYPEDQAQGVHDFALAENAVHFLRDYVGPFPFEKLANVQSTTRYGGMENASAIFYAERAVRGDRRNESLIVHETAHQWFGDSVTELGWPHIWLSEGFATYLTHLYREESYGREALTTGMEADRRTVIRFHSARPGLPLIPVQLTDPEEMLNPNAYQKGAWVLHMLRREMGEERFKAAVREFYRRFRDSNASSSDFGAVVEEEAGRDLDWFFGQWTQEAGHPVLSTEWAFDAEEELLTLTVRQLQDGFLSFRFPLDLATESQDGTLTPLGRVQVVDREQTFSFPLSAEPQEVVLDPDTWLLFEEGRG